MSNNHPTNPWKLGSQRGFGLVEAIIAFGMLMIVTLSLAQLLTVAVRSGVVDQYRVEAMNLARAKLEELEAIPYDQLGILPAEKGDSKGAGYFETDPLYNPAYGENDRLLSDKVLLSGNRSASRDVTIEAIDHGFDKTGDADWDKVRDPNTGTILDYKVVRVRVNTMDPASHQPFYIELSAIMRGILDEEIDGADGEEPSLEEDGTPTKKGKKEKAVKKTEEETIEGEDHIAPEKGKKEKARKKKSDETDA